MTQHITTGPYPGQPGACIAQYNHVTLSHTPHHHSSHNPSSHHNHIIPYIQHPFTFHNNYGNYSWGASGASFPSFY
ncbi:hypothetical protein V7152_17615 [Neobacillus drentensis]|uniref:hypothetical protein n=1 Tax=Neobacillus drentensis TaxID=220684 RepID=UPI0030007D78